MAKKTFKEFVKENKKTIVIGCVAVGATVIGGLVFKNCTTTRRALNYCVGKSVEGSEGWISLTEEQMINLFGENRHFVDRVGTTCEVTDAILFVNVAET